MVATVGRIQIALSADLQRFVGQFDTAARQVGAFAGRVDRNLNVLAGGMGRFQLAATRAATSMKGFLTGAAIAGGLSQIRAVVAEAAGLVDTADKIGVTTKELQGLRFAGKQSGVEIAGLDDALAKFSKTIGEASRGGGDLYEILRANNVEIRDQSGKVRPLSELFAEYANLVRGAQSAQEKNLLVTRAFGRAADEMGNLFANGADGVRAFLAEADRLGIIIDDDKLRRIAAIDDRWDAFATTLSTKVKSAILTVVDDFDRLLDRMNKLSEQSDINIRIKLGDIYDQRQALQRDIARIERDLANPIASGLVGKSLLESNLADAKTRLEGLTQQALELRDILDRRQGYVPPGETAPTPPEIKPTIIPPAAGGSSNRDRAAETLAALRFEGEQLGRTATAQRVYNELKKAGVELSSEAGQAIAAEVEKNAAAAKMLDELAAAQTRFAESGTYLGETLVGALDAVLIQGEKAEDVIANLAKQLASAALQASLLGTGPLAGLFGGGGGSNAGGLFSALLGGFGAGSMTTGMLYHSGGRVGDVGSGRRAIPSAMAAIAPRFHAGLTSDEFLSVLKKGEHVLTADIANRTSGTIAGLGSSIRRQGDDGAPTYSRGGRGVTANFNISTPNPQSFRQSEGQIMALLNRTLARAPRFR